jgi:outer membrane protein TolC
MEASGWTYNRVCSNFLPQISANLGVAETTTGTPSITSKSYSYGLSGTQYLFKGMENIYALQSAWADYEYYKANFENTRASVYYDVRSAFVDLLVAEENVKLLQEILDQRKENTRLINLRYQSGNEDQGNLMQTKADQAEAEYNLSSANRELRLAKLKLSQLVGKDIESADGTIEAQRIERPDFGTIEANIPSYAMAKYKLESAEIQKKSTISGFLPSVSLNANWNKRGNDWPPESEGSSWSLNASYSFFPGGGNFIDPIIYNLKLDQAKEDFEKSKKDLRFSLEDAYEGFEDALESAIAKKISLSATEERAKIAQAKYLNGLVSYDDWVRIQNDHISAQKTFLSSHKSALLAEAFWHKINGGFVK